MRILVINWQDRLNPQAGGAEIHLHEIFGRLASRGHRVTLLVSGWPGAPAEERVDGMRVVRAGGRYTFPLAVRRAFRLRVAAEQPELLVEDINKLPLFTPCWSGVPVVGVVPHLFGTTAFRQETVPVAATVWLAERLMPCAYGRTPLVAISESTAGDLETRGFSRGAIRVVFPGIDHDRFRPDPATPRFPEPTAAYVGRLRRYKGLDVVLRALGRVAADGTPLQLKVAGRGDDAARLARVARRCGVAERVEFLGFLNEGEKVDLLRRAWVHVYPSPKEGWGIANLEAAACGTPCLASDSPGLRESVRDGETGFLVPHTDASAWAARLGEICADPQLRERLGHGGVAFAARFSWERAAGEMEEILLSRSGDRSGGRSKGKEEP